MTTTWRTTAGLLLVVFPAVSFAAQPQQAGTTAYQIENTQVVAIRSRVLKRDYDLYVKLPNSYAARPRHRYPILFLNDSRYSFPLVSSLTRQLANAERIEELIVVGISYSKGDDGDVSRTRDYTPTHSPDEMIGHSTAARLASGQAPAYLRFLTDEVFPFVAKTYRTNLSKKTYAGHSFGGLFGTYVLIVAPNTFENYVLSDPSLWYDNRVVFSLSRQPSKEIATSPNVLIVSSNPTNRLGHVPFDMVDNAQRMEALLKNTLGEQQVKLEIGIGEIHETIFPIAMSHGLLRFHGK